MTDRLNRLMRVETARRQMLSASVARGARHDAKLKDLREQLEALSAHTRSTSNELSRYFGRQYKRLNCELRVAESAHAEMRQAVLEQQRAMETWQTMLTRERTMLQRVKDQSELTGIIEAMLAAVSAASFP